MVSRVQMLKPGDLVKVHNIDIQKRKAPWQEFYHNGSPTVRQPHSACEIKNKCSDVVLVALSLRWYSACCVSILAILGHFYYYRRISFTIGWQFEIQLYSIFHYTEECFQSFAPKMPGDALPCFREVLTRGWL